MTISWPRLTSIVALASSSIPVRLRSLRKRSLATARDEREGDHEHGQDDGRSVVAGGEALELEAAPGAGGRALVRAGRREGGAGDRRLGDRLALEDWTTVPREKTSTRSHSPWSSSGIGRDDHHGAVGGRGVAEDPVELDPRADVDAVGRFVGEEHARLGQQRASRGAPSAGCRPTASRPVPRARAFALRAGPPAGRREPAPGRGRRSPPELTVRGPAGRRSRGPTAAGRRLPDAGRRGDARSRPGWPATDRRDRPADRRRGSRRRSLGDRPARARRNSRWPLPSTPARPTISPGATARSTWAKRGPLRSRTSRTGRGCHRRVHRRRASAGRPGRSSGRRRAGGRRPRTARRRVPCRGSHRRAGR